MKSRSDDKTAIFPSTAVRMSDTMQKNINFCKFITTTLMDHFPHRQFTEELHEFNVLQGNGDLEGAGCSEQLWESLPGWLDEKDDATELLKKPGVTAVVQDSATTKLHKTQSPDFLGLNVNYSPWPDTGFGQNVIIGLVDNGIWPESASFNDNGLGPVPSGWKGKCEFNSSLCNKQLIGTRVFQSGFKHFIASGSTEDYIGGNYKSPRDGTGRGTHTASIAAGSAVPGANMLGFGKGTARGIATKARLAMYKTCTQGICADSDIFAAIESAIEGIVHKLSLSLGTRDGPHYEYVIARGAFAAVKRCIFCSMLC
ncbi:hypothetical protein LguiB_018948 [Lonicera macranthoides]